ncbi:MAG TPA: dipeptidase [Bacteroidales bacterium]|nr:dipeptidase [Bacteroidales bacterium]
MSVRLFSFIALFLLVSNLKTHSQSDLHHRLLTLDSHTDTPMMLDEEGYSFGKRNDADATDSRLDLVRMEEGGLDAVFFAVFTSQGERSEKGRLKAREHALRTFDLIEKNVADNAEKVAVAYSPSDAYRNVLTGKKSIFIGMENGFPIGLDIGLIADFYERGARYITLCHSKNNDICDSSTDKAEHNGLSPFGEEVVKEMNRLGMMIDVSHISDEAFFDVLKITKTPVIASHSNARTVCNHPRNLSDEMLLALKANGGVVQVCVLTAYVKEAAPNAAREQALKELREKYNNFTDLSPDQRKEAGREWRAVEKKFPNKLATVSDLVDHIDYIVQLIGIDHVGFGSDFDGGGMLSACKDVSQLPAITTEMLRRGYSEDDLQKFWSGNFLRVFGEIQAAAASNR